VLIEDLSSTCSDIDELAAVIAALDLTITVANTLAHLGGALGKPTWVLLSPTPEWRYPRAGQRMPWYSSLRLYRRTNPGDATDIMTQVRNDLSREYPKALE
jgi:ADP-heptose:LPS heptosyltransferase